MGYHSGIEYYENKLIYSGYDNYLTYKRFYAEEFSCDYDLHWYPFDYQICQIKIKPFGDLLEEIHFENDVFVYNGSYGLTEFDIRKIDMEVEEDFLYVDIGIQRRLFRLVMTTFIPTIILNIIGHAANFFKEFFFEGMMGVQITVMLVLTTMFLNINDNLPPTSYIKMIDYWLIFNLLKPFVDIIFQTYIESLRSDEDKENSEESVIKDDQKLKQGWPEEGQRPRPASVKMDELKYLLLHTRTLQLLNLF